MATCSGGTGSNVYSRSLARAWSQLGHDVTVFSQEPASRALDLGGAKRSYGPTSGVSCRSSSSIATRISRPVASRTSAGPSANRFVEANAAALREHLPADVVFTNHVILGAPVGAGDGRAVRGQDRTARSSTFSMRRPRGAPGWAREIADDRAPGRGRHRAHPARARGGRSAPASTLERVRRSRPASTSGSSAPRAARRRWPALVAEARLDPPNPGRRTTSGCRTRATPSGFAAFLEGGRPTVVYFGSSAARRAFTCSSTRSPSGDVRAVMVGFGEESGRPSRRRRLRSGVRGALSRARSSIVIWRICWALRTST